MFTLMSNSSSAVIKLTDTEGPWLSLTSTHTYQCMHAAQLHTPAGHILALSTACQLLENSHNNISHTDKQATWYTFSTRGPQREGHS